MRYRLQRHDGTDCSATMVPITVLRMVPIQRYRQIPVEAREKLFKPFAEIRDLTQGNGLGLPTCSLIAYKLNGTLTLDTDYKKGTRFILELHV